MTPPRDVELVARVERIVCAVAEGAEDALEVALGLVVVTKVLADAADPTTRCAVALKMRRVAQELDPDVACPTIELH